MTDNISFEFIEKLLFCGDIHGDLEEIVFKINIVATHTTPSFAYPTTKHGIEMWLQHDEGLNQTIDHERETMDKIFTKLKEQQHNITDWYYGHFHEHKLEQHHGINFRLCDCGEINEFFGNRKVTD